MTILQKIASTYRYTESRGNLAQKNDMKELMGAFAYCAAKSGGRVRVAHRLDRNMKRIKSNGSWSDMPADGHSDITPARENEALSTPVLILLRENGKKEERKDDPNHENIGWNNAPFYWPVLMTQKDIAQALFAVDQKGPSNVVVNDFEELTKGIDKADILNLTYQGDLISHFGEVGDEYSLEDAPVETRAIRDTTQSLFLAKDLDGNLALNPDATIDEENWAGVYSYNHGKFPFILKPYKYMLLRAGRNKHAAAILLELFPKDKWEVFAHQETDDNGMIVDYITPSHVLIGATDTLINKHGDEKDYIHKYICQWVVRYPVKKVLGYIDRAVSQDEEQEEEQ